MVLRIILNKKILKRWESFREVAMKRQTAINEKLMRLQRKEMTAIREWMTNTEDKISRFVWRDGSSVCFSLKAWLPDGYTPIFRSYVFGPHAPPPWRNPRKERDKISIVQKPEGPNAYSLKIWL